MKQVLVLIFFILLCFGAIPQPTFSYHLFKPVQYPAGVISNNHLVFFWQDLEQKLDSNKKVFFRLTLYKKNKKLKTYSFQPKIKRNNFYYFKIYNAWPDGVYSYKIEKIVNGKVKKDKYYYYQKYPFTNNFEIDSSRVNQSDYLSSNNMIEYHYLARENLINNGYPFLFSSFAGASTLGLGVLFYKFFSFGLLTKVAYSFSFTSSALGLGLAGYYGYNYTANYLELNKVLEVNKKISLGGKVLDQEYKIGFNLKF